MPTEHPDIKSIFGKALELADPRARAAYLDEACGGNAALRTEVEGLLAALGRAGAFLDPAPAGNGLTGDAAPAPGTATYGRADGVTSETADYPGRDEAVGEVIAGKYKLVEAIGEGGMGSVFLAQQTEPVKRLVAVKVIKAGMDSKAVLARFDAERQALAMMDHPNIARVLDAGTTESGRPFFVMELVKGIPITQFCDERKLTPRQRLELFVPVCQAVQHAHQKGVIHRDLKPTNVLVALYDERPVPKVIDFGVAKATGPQLTEYTLVTGLGAVVGTPEYMSPEQASFNQLDVDTRSDIYSLGVLLYELLTGTTPIDRKSLGKAALLEVLRIVREVEAPRPSNKLSSSQALPSIAATRGLEPRKLTGLLRGELDWIVMKALEKDRSRRYETANGFAADVLRYLAGEPVQAVPPSAGYRLRKFLRKHRGPVAAAAAVTLALVVGIIGTGWGLVEARSQRDAAESAGRRESERRTEVEEQKTLLEQQKTLLEEQKKEAETARREADVELHDNQRVLLRQAWDAGETAKMRSLLDQMRPKPGRSDLRGFETHYMDRAVHAEIDRIAYSLPRQSFEAQVFGEWSSGRVLYQGVLAKNRLYQTIAAIDLATGRPVEGFEPIRIRWQNEQSFAELYLIRGDPPRLLTSEFTGHTGDLAEFRDVAGYITTQKEIRIWDSRTGRLLAHCQKLFPDPDLIQQGWRHRYLNLMAIASTANCDATVVITQLLKGEIGIDGSTSPGVESRAQLHDLKSGKTIRCLDARPGVLVQALFSFDDKYLVTLHTLNNPGNKSSSQVTVWDAATGASIWSKPTDHRLSGFTRDGQGIAFHGETADPNDKENRAKEAYSLATGKPLPYMPAAIDVSYVRLPNSGLMATASENKLELRDIRTGLILDSFPSAAGPIGLDQGPFLRHWFGDRGQLSFPTQAPAGWSVSTYRSPRTELLPPLPVVPSYSDSESRSWSIQRQPDGTVKFQSVHLLKDPNTKRLRPHSFELFDPANRKTNRVNLQATQFQAQSVNSESCVIGGRTLVIPDLSYSADAGNLESSLFTSRLAVFDLETGRERFASIVTDAARMSEDTVYSLLRSWRGYAVSVDGSRIAFHDIKSKRLVCLNAESGQKQWDVPLPGDGSWWHQPLFLPDGSRLVLSDDSGTICVFDTIDGRVVKRTNDGPKIVKDKEERDIWHDDIKSGVTSDGRTLHFTYHGVLTLINTTDWSIRHRLGTETPRAQELSDGRTTGWKSIDDRFALLQTNEDVQVWDIRTGQQVSRFELSGYKTPGGRVRIDQAIYNRDASRAFLLTDNSIRVVDLRRGREVLVLKLRDTRLSHLSLDSTDQELTFTIFDTQSGTVMRRVFDGRPLTVEELARGKRLNEIRLPAVAPKQPEKPPVTASDYMNLAVDHIEKGSWKEAVIAYRAAVKLEPDFHALHSRLALALERSGDPDGAIAAYREAIRIAPRDFISRYRIGILLESKRDYRGAIAAHREALRADTRNNSEASFEVFGSILYHMPTRAAIHNALGYALREDGDLIAAEKEIREALRLVSGEREFQAVLYMWPRPSSYINNLAGCLLRQRKAKEAKAECEAYVERLAALIAKGKTDPNLANLAVGLPITLAETLTDFGHEFWVADYWSESVIWSDRAIEQFKDNYKNRPGGLETGIQRAYLNKAVALNWLDRGQEAVEAIDESIRLSPEPDKTYQRMMRARYVAKTGDHRTAAKQVKALLAEPNPSPNNWDSALALSLCVKAAKGDEKLQEQYAADAVALLRKVLDAKSFDYPWRKDPDLDPIRDRADFKKLFAEFEEKSPLPRVTAPPPREKK